MALNGIGGGDAGSALERFQALRDSAKKKLAGEDSQAGLAELIKRKQSELGAGGAIAAGGINAVGGAIAGSAARTSAERIPSKPATPPVSGAYGRSGITQKQDPKPTLGRHVDFMA